jgi:hypothetical protein
MIGDVALKIRQPLKKNLLYSTPQASVALLLVPKKSVKFIQITQQFFVRRWETGFCSFMLPSICLKITARIA